MEVTYWRRVYEDRYRDIRNKVYVHKEVATVEEANDLMATTNIEEMKALFSFLSGLEGALWEAFNNGIQPSLNEREFILWPEETTNVTTRPGEKVYRQGYAVLKSLKAVNPK